MLNFLVLLHMDKKTYTRILPFCIILYSSSHRILNLSFFLLSIYVNTTFGCQSSRISSLRFVISLFYMPCLFGLLLVPIYLYTFFPQTSSPINWKKRESVLLSTSCLHNVVHKLPWKHLCSSYWQVKRID